MVISKKEKLCVQTFVTDRHTGQKPIIATFKKGCDIITLHMIYNKEDRTKHTNIISSTRGSPEAELTHLV
jgi:hypothetical protein